MATTRGIGFPFRIGVRGGVVMTELSENSLLHVIDSMEQVLMTNVGERGMNQQFGSTIDTDVFSPNDKSGHTLIAHQVKVALSNHDPNVVVSNVDIYGEGSNVFAKISFTLKNFDGVYFANIRLGEMAQ